MNEGLAGSALILAMASWSVPIALGLAGLSKPTWLSLICRKVSLLGSAARAWSMMPSDRGTPPEIVHSTPVPAHVIHSNTFRRCMPGLPSPFLDSLIVFLRACVDRTDAGETGGARGLFPGESRGSQEAVSSSQSGIDRPTAES